ncbi:TPA: hypothetical protein JG855_004584 [Vibrio parahaemolyticus]|uniref:hypothetical protein n=1 Tax=Vibrio TaxID=662 RepID=UPI0003DD01D2|nr:hypothetical protein [Vibrio parahaemolyticus]EGQ9921460.1 hypothetical protein [Vibrio parahaemolyticus]EHZ2593782.1 hypothetical protein [Vibrio parahaemolyticus]EJT0911474.1 hypothetical protein [Vibrio parahaemolyticus]ELA7934810.1 hypothetical protein [Vibrio parahaemolyticus]ETJ87314.1 hypothetical protein D029_3423 [Vibrio parahaemolyticus 970107]
MKTKLVVLVSALLASQSASAAFKSNNWSDEMNDVKVYEQYTSNRGSSIGFRCDVQKGKHKDFMLTFASKENVATPSNGRVEIKMRVDDGEVYNLKGKTYSNSYKSGVIRNIPESLLNSIRSGNKLLVNIHVYNQLKMNQSFSLSGSAKALQQTADRCDFVVKSNPELERKIKEIERKRDKEIKEITSKYAKEIQTLKASYK